MADAEQAAARFRLRPRRAWAVWAMLAFGGALCVLPFVYGVTGTPRLIDLVAGLGVIATASLYLGAPTWRSCVRIDQRGLALESPRGERFHLDWNEVTEVIADQDEQAAFVRGPSSARSFLVPSSAHPAPYRIERSAELYARIVAAVPEEKIRKSRSFQ